jgi:HSP20 family protein
LAPLAALNWLSGRPQNGNRRENPMAETKVQSQSSEQRDVARREERGLTREPFGFFSPFSMMRRLSEEMDRAFGSSFGLPRVFGEEGAWSPAVEVREHNGNLEIRAELPGMSKDDVKVECTEDAIVIEGEKRREERKEERGYHRSEISYGRFYRAIPLPQGADAGKANAEFKDGVLKIEVPVPEQQRKSREIQVKG